MKTGAETTPSRLVITMWKEDMDLVLKSDPLPNVSKSAERDTKKITIKIKAMAPRMLLEE